MVLNDIRMSDSFIAYHRMRRQIDLNYSSYEQKDRLYHPENRRHKGDVNETWKRSDSGIL